MMYPYIILKAIQYSEQRAKYDLFFLAAKMACMGNNYRYSSCDSCNAMNL